MTVKDWSHIMICSRNMMTDTNEKEYTYGGSS